MKSSIYVGDPMVAAGMLPPVDMFPFEQWRCEPQLELHIGASLNVRLDPQQIIETFLHASVYCGFPSALNAVAVARKAVTECGLLPAT